MQVSFLVWGDLNSRMKWHALWVDSHYGCHSLLWLEHPTQVKTTSLVQFLLFGLFFFLPPPRIHAHKTPRFFLRYMGVGIWGDITTTNAPDNQHCFFLRDCPLLTQAAGGAAVGQLLKKFRPKPTKIINFSKSNPNKKQSASPELNHAYYASGNYTLRTLRSLRLLHLTARSTD